jgi:hypothetical protein
MNLTDMDVIIQAVYRMTIMNLTDKDDTVKIARYSGVSPFL